MHTLDLVFFQKIFGLSLYWLLSTLHGKRRWKPCIVSSVYYGHGFLKGVLFMYIWNPIQREQISNIFMFGGLSPRCGSRVSSFYFVCIFLCL
jgi:hypothetical protein